MHNLGPKAGGVGLFLIDGLVAVDRILLLVGLAVDGCLHEGVIDAHRHVGTCHFALFHLGVDKRLGVGVLDADGEHQGATASVLCHLTRAVAVTHHERHQAGRRQGAVLDGRALGTDVRQIVSYTTTAFHQLHLLLVNLEDAAVTVRLTVEAYNEAVAQRAHLEIIADAGHGATLGNDVAEVAHQFKQAILGQWIGILILDTGNLACNATVHIVGRQFIQVAE